jgi:hypothetical protein
MPTQQPATPFGDDSLSFGVAGLTVENGTDQIKIYGEGVITRDKAGQKALGELLDFLELARARLSEDRDLPEHVKAVGSLTTSSDPFA